MKTKLCGSIRTLLIATSLAYLPSTMHAGASPSELLEKGIYTEETKGDLEGAITIYQQLVAEAKAGQSLAAQAQFRLGQCLQKKNRAVEATAAFEKLIADFPGEKELVAKAREHLPAQIALGPVPWVDGERLQLILSLAAGMEIGTMELRADLVEAAGRKAWRIGRRMTGGGEMLSSVDVDAETFQPFTSYWKHTLLGEVTATFKPGEVEMQKTGADPTTIRPEKTPYDNEEFMHLMRRLPLAVGYKTTIPTITTLGGGAVLQVGLEVTAKETVEVPAGSIDCFKVPLTIAQTFWISDDANRYLVKFEGGGAIGKLASVTQRKPGTPVPFRDDTLGVSFTAPADWVIQRQSGERKGKVTIHLLDPAADADHVILQLKPTESLSAAERQSPRAWAETNFREDHAKSRENFKLRADSWKNRVIAGRPGVSCLADFTESGKPKTALAIYVLGSKTCENFVLVCPTDKIEALTPAFESIIASYRMTK